MSFQPTEHYEACHAVQTAFDILFSQVSNKPTSQFSNNLTPAKLYGKNSFQEICQKYIESSNRGQLDESDLDTAEPTSAIYPSSPPVPDFDEASIPNETSYEKEISPVTPMPRKSARSRKPVVPFKFDQTLAKTLKKSQKDQSLKAKNKKMKSTSTVLKSTPKKARAEKSSRKKNSSKIMSKPRTKTVTSQASLKKVRNNSKASSGIDKTIKKRKPLGLNSKKSTLSSSKKPNSSIEALLTSGYGAFDEMIDNFLDEGTHYRPGEHLHTNNQRAEHGPDRRPSWLANYQRRATRLPYVQQDFNPLEDDSFDPSLNTRLPNPTSVFVPFQKSGNHLF